MEFDGVETSPATLGDLWIRQSVTDEIDRAPFGRRQNVRVGRSSSSLGHRQIVAAKSGNYPPLGRASDVAVAEL